MSAYGVTSDEMGSNADMESIMSAFPLFTTGVGRKLPWIGVCCYDR